LVNFFRLKAYYPIVDRDLFTSPSSW